MGKTKENAVDLIHKAQAALHQKHQQEARSYFFLALEAAPDHPDAHYGLATVSFHQGDVLAAAYHFREVIRHDVGRAGAYVNLGAIYNHLGRDDDAVVILRKGIQLDPNRAEGFYNLGLVLRKMGRIDDAAAAYQEAVRLQPGLGEAHFNLANLYLDAEEFTEAIVQYREALKSRSNWPAARQGLAIAEAALHDPRTTVPLTDAAAAPPPPTPIDESKLTRLIDPNIHHAILGDIHKTVAEADTCAKSLGGEVAQQLDAAMKELAQCFLRSDTPGFILAKRLEAFEAAATRVKNAQHAFEQLHSKMAKFGDDLKKL